MRKALVLVSLLALAVPAIGSFATAPAMADDDNSFGARLTGYQEVPTLATTGRGQFRARLLNPTTLEYQLQYSNLEGVASEAHIHLGQRATNGGVIAWLCGALAVPPKPLVCPASGTLTGTIVAADVIGPTAQGIAVGEFAELISALRAGATYVDVHTVLYPSGEIRGQIGERD